MQRLTLIAMSFMLSLGAALGVLIYIALVPHRELIGWGALALLGLGGFCGGRVLWAWTNSKVAQLKNKSRIIIYNDFLVWRNDNGTFEHLSGKHHQMAQLPPGTVTVSEDDEDVPDLNVKAALTLHDHDQSERHIAKELHISRRKVSEILTTHGRK